jgi:hypothetical protein
MNKTLAFVLIWSSFCFLATMASFQLDMASIAAVIAEFWLTAVGIDLATGD